MDQTALIKILAKLITTWENEVIEFKEASSDYSTSKIGQYFSALANEANLQSLERGWLVFGVNNNSRAVVGTNYREDVERLNGLKQQVADGTGPSLSFRNIHVLDHPDGRVVLLEIPGAPQGMPIAWNGHFYARNGESLAPLALNRLDEIRAQTSQTDWTAQVVEGATLDDLDPTAVARAREAFSKKHANSFDVDVVAKWSDDVLLDRARVTQNGRITRTALLLLGKAESAYLLSPHKAELTWKLIGPETAYEHFGPPFLLNSSALFRKIRNIQLRILPDNELLVHEISKYDQKVVLEALHNCIAHQDYTRNARIVVTEQADRLTLESEGSFFEGEPDDYVGGSNTPRRYRNPFLVQAMTELNMIDTMGFGIHRIFEAQRRRYFPMPDYDLSISGVVSMVIHGGVVDSAYSRLLIQNTNLELMDVLAVDRVQKQLPISDQTARHLRRLRLIEGRKPNYRVSAAVAAATATREEYIRNRPLDDLHYEEIIVEYLRKFSRASRRDIDGLLWEMLSGSLDEAQRKYKIGNLLSGLRRKHIIFNAASKTAPEWKIQE